MANMTYSDDQSKKLLCKDVLFLCNIVQKKIRDLK